MMSGKGRTPMKKRQFLQFYQDRRMGGILILILLTLLGVGIYSYSQRVNESSDPVLQAEQKVDAPSEVLELAQQKVDETIQFYTSGWNLLDDNGKLEKIKILDSQITNLQLAKRVDVYNRMVGQRVIEGIHSAYDDFYFFSYRLLPDENDLKGKKLSLKLDDEGWISFDKITPYTADMTPGDLLLIVSYVDGKVVGSNMTRTAELSDDWYEEYENQRLPDYDAQLTEEDFRVIDEYSFYFSDGGTIRAVNLKDRQYALPVSMKEMKRRQSYTDYNADYMSEITYGGMGNQSQFLIRTLNYNMPDAPDALAVIIAMTTDRQRGPKTFRGIAAGSSVRDLLRLYPDHLYYLSKDAVSGYFTDNQGNSDFDCAYFYYPPDQTSNDITFYIKNQVVSSIEMVAAYERRYAYDNTASSETLVNQPSNRKSEFLVETAAEFSKEIALSGDQLGMSLSPGETVICRVDIKLPKVSAAVSNGAFLNENLGLERYLDVIQKLKAGDVSLLQQERLVEYTLDYAVYKRNGAAALVMNESYGIAEAGRGNHQTVWYYDSDTGNVLSAREYAKKCGVKEADIIKQYNDNASFGVVNSVYETNFYIDRDGKVLTHENFDT